MRRVRLDRPFDLECEKEMERKKKKKAYGTRYSQAVTHPSTNRARRCLTSVIRRERVLSTWYGRRQKTHSRRAYLSLAGQYFLGLCMARGFRHFPHLPWPGMFSSRSGQPAGLVEKKKKTPPTGASDEDEVALGATGSERVQTCSSVSERVLLRSGQPAGL